MSLGICTRCSVRLGIFPRLEQMSLRSLSKVQSSSRFLPTKPQSLSIRAYASKVKANAKNKPLPKSKPLPSRPPTTVTQKLPEPAFVSRELLYAQTLLRRLSATPLYIGPSSHVYPWACIIISGWCFAYGAWHLYDAYFVAHPGLLWIVPHLMAGVAVFVAGAGVWIGLGARGHLAAINAVPLTSKSPAASSLSKTTPSTTLLIQAERRSLLPFNIRRQSRLIECDVDKAEIKRRIKSIIAERQQEDAETRQRRLKSSPAWKLLILPITDIYGVLSKSIARVIQREGFADVYLKGQKFKIDTRNGWLADNGQAIDRLFKPRS